MSTAYRRRPSRGRDDEAVADHGDQEGLSARGTSAISKRHSALRTPASVDCTCSGPTPAARRARSTITPVTVPTGCQLAGFGGNGVATMGPIQGKGQCDADKGESARCDNDSGQFCMAANWRARSCQPVRRATAVAVADAYGVMQRCYPAVPMQYSTRVPRGSRESGHE